MEHDPENRFEEPGDGQKVDFDALAEALERIQVQLNALREEFAEVKEELEAGKKKKRRKGFRDRFQGGPFGWALAI